MATPAKRHSRHGARKNALRILYRLDVSTERTGGEFLPEPELVGRTGEYCHTLVKGVCSYRDEIDGLVNASSENWAVDRMPVIDRNILRIAVYELKHQPGVPFKVVIDEAVELANLYGSEQSGAFINGVLDKIFKQKCSKMPATAGPA